MLRFGALRMVALGMLVPLLGCETGPESRVVTLRSCFVDFWAAHRQGDGPWTPVEPDASGQVSFEATSRTSLAVAYLIPFSGVRSTVVINATAGELANLGRLDCEQPTGTQSVSGTVDFAPGSMVDIAMGDRQFVHVPFDNSVTTASWSLTELGAAPIDLIAAATSGGLNPGRFLVRRDITPASQSLGTLDLSGTEAHDADLATLTVSGMSSGHGIVAAGTITTRNGTTIFLRGSGAGATYSQRVLPPSLQRAGDVHAFSGVVVSSDSRDQRIFVLPFTPPGNHTLAIGPALASPTASALGTAPPVRMRAGFASQPEYPDGVHVVFDAPFRRVEVVTTAAYLGGTPSAWEVEIPDLSEAGYLPEWGMNSGASMTAASAIHGSPFAIVSQPSGNDRAVLIATRFTFQGSPSAGTPALDLVWKRVIGPSQRHQSGGTNR